MNLPLNLPLFQGLDLGLFEKSNRPSRRGGGWTLDFSESPTDPLGGGGWTLDFQKERIQVEGGGCYKVTLVSRSTYQRVLVGSRAIITPHHPTTVQLTRVAGGGRFYAVCVARETWRGSEDTKSSRGGSCVPCT